jgi:tellurite resistance protein TerC
MLKSLRGSRAPPAGEDAVQTSPFIWAGFLALVAALLALDLGVLQRRMHAIKIREALLWSAFWISLALLFNLGIYFRHGQEAAFTYLTAYVVEKSLSVDNLFVFLLIFKYFAVNPKYQHRVLYWGILGALVMRAIFIFAGIALISQFHWIIYIFGAVLIFSGGKLVFDKDKEVHPERNPVIKLVRKLLPVTKEMHEHHFFVRVAKKTWATPLFVVLVVIETSDVVFAVDSIPAVLAISIDPFIVYTSNVFAILGLRALYFALAGIMPLFRYLNYGLALILSFVGVKMIISGFYKVPTALALSVIAGIMTIAIVASLLRKPAPSGGHA